MSKIVVPEALKAIADERNFFLYQMPMKIPVGVGKVARAKNTDAAAVSTLWEVVEKLEYLERKPEVLESINREKAEWIQKTKPDVEPRKIEWFCAGYVPRVDSAGVVIDLDDCVDKDSGVVTLDDFALQAAFDVYEGYWEVSPSGEGIRVVMPRVPFEDEMRSDRREAGGVGFQAQIEKAKGFTLMLTGGDRPWLRDDRLVEEAVRVRDAGLTARRERGVDTADLGEVAFEWVHVTIEDLEGMLDVIPNGGPEKSDRGWFTGMTKAIREAFEPRGLGEDAWELWDHWLSIDPPKRYDPEWNRRVWDEPLKEDVQGRRTIGSLIKEAEGLGWRGSWEETEVKSDGEFDFSLYGDDEVKSDKKKDAVDWDDPFQRVFVVGSSFYDLKNREMVSDGGAKKITRDYPMMWDTGKPVEWKNREVWMTRNLVSADVVDFWPGKDRVYRVGDYNVLNTYVALPTPVGGPDTADVWVNRVREVLGDHADLIFDWMAFVLQNPGKKVGWAPVLISEHEGAGKDFTFRPMMEFLGGYAGSAGMRQLDDDKNAGVIMNKMFLLIQEAAKRRYQDREEMAEVLKEMIADSQGKLTVRAMRKDHFEVRNVLNVAAVCNHLDALQIDMKSRRYYPILVKYGADFSSEEKTKAWVEPWEWVKKGKGDGWKAVTRWLLNRKVKRVSEGMNAPVSSDMRKVVESGLPPGAEWVEDYCEGRSWVSTRLIKEASLGAEFGGGDKVPTGKLLVKCLEVYGFKQLGEGRVSVKANGRTQNHLVYAKPGVVLATVKEVLRTGDSDFIDKSQRTGHLKIIS